MRLSRTVFCARALLIIIALLISIAMATAQFIPAPDCCSQVINLKARYDRTLLVLDSTRAVTQRVIDAADKRAATALQTANTAIANQQVVNDKLTSQNEALGANLDERTSQLETTKEELDKWRPKTKAGVFFRKVRNGLAVVGSAAIVVAVVLFR